MPYAFIHADSKPKAPKRLDNHVRGVTRPNEAFARDTWPDIVTIGDRNSDYRNRLDEIQRAGKTGGRPGW